MTWPATDEDGFGPADVANHVSRETLDRIHAFLSLLDAWRTRINLIGPSEGRHLWRRHVLDSVQLLDLVPASARKVADLGTGAGFPGVVLACAFLDRPDVHVSLVEKSVRKCEFLEAAVSALDLRASVLNARIEDLPAHEYDVITARALSPLPKLLGYADHLLKPSGTAILPKGRDAALELTQARESWNFDVSDRASLSSPDGRILTITELSAGRRTS